MTSSVRTSLSDPLRVFWVPELPIDGALGLTLAPGKRGRSYFGFTWERDLEADLERLREHHRADVLVSLMEDFEYPMLGVPDLLHRAQSHGLEVRHFPIQDLSVPAPDRAAAFDALVTELRADLNAGRRVVVHCRGGIGRSGLVAASIVTTFGDAAREAIARVRRAQPKAVETAEQARYVETFANRTKSQLPLGSSPVIR
jgi:ADP-ribosyl-[dinitrogen reductase] hydrolase